MDVMTLWKTANAVAIICLFYVIVLMVLGWSWPHPAIFYAMGVSFFYAVFVGIKSLGSLWYLPGFLASTIFSWAFLEAFFGATSSGAEQGPAQKALAFVLMCCVLFNLLGMQIRLHQQRSIN